MKKNKDKPNPFDFMGRFVFVFCRYILLLFECTLEEVQEWLGHEDITTTANIYGHLEFQSKNKMADKLNVALSKHG